MKQSRWGAMTVLVMMNLGGMSACGDAGGISPEAEDRDGVIVSEPFPSTPEPGVEEEVFLVKQLATTSSYVFVPNSSPGSYNVARIDGRDFDILPLRVGAEPKEVRAAEVDGVGAVAYVLCEGDYTVAIIRADELGQDGKNNGHVSLVRVPQEVNALTLSPDGRHAIAYIDQSEPLLEGTSVASLQTMALIRLGDAPGEDEVFQLSVTRQIREISFDESGSRAFIVGKEGVNVLDLDEVTQDRFVPPLRLDLSDEVFPPEDLEIEVSRAGDRFAVRSTQLDGVAVFALDEEGQIAGSGRYALPEFPTDIDLLERPAPERSALVVTLRAKGEVLWLDQSALLEGLPEDEVIIERFETTPTNGLTQLSEAMNFMVTYSTAGQSPSLDVLDLSMRGLTQYPLLNRIRSLAISEDGQTAIAVHHPGTVQVEEGEELTSQQRFRLSYGVTLVDLPTGYRRPVVLEGEPVELVTVEAEDGTQLLYIMQTSQEARTQGVVRLDLQSFRQDFTQLAREPTQIGLVAGKLFVNQRAPEGRITFIDLETGAQRTVSGYELNARID